MHFSICSFQWQLLNFPDAGSKWVERWQKNLLWFKWVRGQCYSVCLIIYLPSYTQHLLSLEWFKHIITSCFSSFIMLVCCYSVVRNLSWPLQSRDVISRYSTLMCLPHVFFLSFPFIKWKVLRTALDAFGLGRIGSVSSKSLPPMSCGDKWVWGQVLSKACILESDVCVNAKSISLCSGILREVLTKTPMDFSMKSGRLLLFLQSPAMQWMHSHIQILEMMHVRSELRFWASWSPGVSCSLNFALF